MPNSYFRFKQFTVHQELAAMKVTTDACLFGAWVAANLRSGQPSHSRILDIGAGTGLLSLMAAQQTDASIDAIEIDPQAALQAMQNFSKSPWSERLNVITGDVRAMAFDKRYDIVLSNPPFYENDLSGASSRKNIAHHDEGLLLKELVDVIVRTTAENAVFYLLLPVKRFEEVKELCAASGLFIYRICRVKQSLSHGFFRILIKGGKTKQDVQQEEMAIRDESNNYSSQFADHLAPYYLYL